MSDSSAPGNSNAAQQHRCPNSSCPLVFSSIADVCAHLSVPGLACTEWTQEFIDNLLHRENIEDDLDDDEQIASIMPLFDAGNVNTDDEDDLLKLPSVILPTTTEAPPSVSLAGLRKEYHPNRSAYATGAGGKNMLQQMDDDKFAAARHESGNIHYPFTSQEEWRLAYWLTHASLPQSEINSFLRLDWVKQNAPSFSTANVLRGWVEQLPDVPRWRYQTFTIPGYSTKNPMTLYWRDGLEVIKHLFSNPVFANCMEFDAYRLVERETNLQVFGEFMSAKYAWDYSSRIPKGDTMLGVIAASDKTPLTIGTGNREMHPVLLSLANIEAGVRMKATSHAFALAAYLPIPKFLNVTPPVHAVLSARVYHICISTIMDGLKLADAHGVVLSDPNGMQRLCHTPLVSWIADLPEQRMIACVLGSQSPISEASSSQFGDSDPHPRRTRELTLDRIDRACLAASPDSVPEFTKVCEALGLNGVYQPFWRSWGNADPSKFLTPDALHQWHKFSFDHILKWIINIMGGDELDRRMAALQPRVGGRHWANGISKLKQCTGREHRDFQKVIVAVAAGGVHSHVIRAIRALIEFIFQAQSLLIYDEHLHALREALREFHFYKNAIVHHGGRRGKKGPILHFNIPKLELMQGVAESARWMGAPYQWTSDVTERCHITHVKTPYRMSNGRNFHEQCTRFMDRIEKTQIFNLYTSLKAGNASLLNEMINEASEVAQHYPEALWLSHVLSPDEISVGHSAPRSSVSLFSKTRSHLSDDNTTAFLVTGRPHIRNILVDDAAVQFHLPDLRGASGDFFVLNLAHAARHGHRRSQPNCLLPWSHVNIWTNFRMQQHSAQDARILLPACTVQALPPSDTMPYGRCNVVLVNDVDGTGDQTSSTGTDRFKVMQVRLIFSPVRPSDGNDSPPIFFYGEYFKFSSQYRTNVDGVSVFAPAPDVDMFQLHRHFRSDGTTRMGDIIRLTDIREIVELVPVYGSQMDPRLDYNNSLELAGTFYLNNFASKETFHAILSYQ